MLTSSWAGIAYLDTIRFDGPEPHGVPESGTLTLLGAALAGLGAIRRRKAAWHR